MGVGEEVQPISGPRAPPTATPYLPTSNWTYYLEAARAQPWPSCAYRFLSYTSDCKHDDLYDSVGVNQEFLLLPRDAGNLTFYLRLSCGKYLSVAGACSNTVVDTWPEGCWHYPNVSCGAPLGEPDWPGSPSLARLPNVLPLPGVSMRDATFWEHSTAFVARNLDALARGEPLKGVVRNASSV